MLAIIKRRSPRMAPVRRACKTCRKEFGAQISKIKRGGGIYCSPICSYRDVARRIKGLERECLVCGTLFTTKPAKSTVYCSRKCAGVAKRKPVAVSCSCCGRDIVRSPAFVNSKLCFCSRECRKEFFGRKNSKTCAACGEVFVTSNSRRKYCSKRCYSNINRGESSSHWKGGQPSRVCASCGQEFNAAFGSVKKGFGKYCSQKCMAEDFSVRFSGENSLGWKSGINRQERLCVVCGKTFFATSSQVKTGRGKCCSYKCSGIYQSEHRAGENHLNWQGGKSLWNNRDSRGPGWPATSREVRRRANYTCRRCGKTEWQVGRRFHAHHIVPFWNFTSRRQANAMSNLECLCSSCHTIVESKVTQRQLVLVGKF